MSVLEAVIAAVFALGGLRSLWRWGRRRFEGVDVVDHLLYALFVTGRVGLWFSIAGLFLIYSTTTLDGRPTSAVDRYRWFLAVPIALAAMQLAAGYFLGNRTPRE
ncbi:MAG: hypothetical protein ACE14W_07540 [Candidatus Velamenicoccus archaeovorus]